TCWQAGRLLGTLPAAPGWRNWQTRRIQNPQSFSGRVGSSPTPGTTFNVPPSVGVWVQDSRAEAMFRRARGAFSAPLAPLSTFRLRAVGVWVQDSRAEALLRRARGAFSAPLAPSSAGRFWAAR